MSTAAATATAIVTIIAKAIEIKENMVTGKYRMQLQHHTLGMICGKCRHFVRDDTNKL